MATTGLEQQQLLIGGEWTAAIGGGTFERVDPLHGRGGRRVAAAGERATTRAAPSTRRAAAFRGWADTPPARAARRAHARRPTS